MMLGLKLSAFLLVNLVMTYKSDAADDSNTDWGYYNVPESEQPQNWKNNFPNCAGSRQSPIHIYSDQAVYKDLGQFKFKGYDGLGNVTFDMKNNGHTVTFTKKGSAEVSVSGGGLPGVYHLAGFHFHWGSSNGNGSEHWINSVHYAAEVHLVHMSEKYTEVKEAVKDKNGLAVLGATIKIEGADNVKYNAITTHIDNVAYKDSPTYSLPHFKIADLLPDDHSKFYRYEGSLTTPACDEAVIWSVFANPITFSQNQIDQFREKLHHTERINNSTDEDYKLADNHRLPQELNDRIVLVNLKSSKKTSDASHCLQSLGGVLLSVALFLSMKVMM